MLIQPVSRGRLRCAERCARAHEICALFAREYRSGQRTHLHRRSVRQCEPIEIAACRAAVVRTETAKPAASQASRRRAALRHSIRLPRATPHLAQGRSCAGQIADFWRELLELLAVCELRKSLFTHQSCDSSSPVISFLPVCIVARLVSCPPYAAPTLPCKVLSVVAQFLAARPSVRKYAVVQLWHGPSVAYGFQLSMSDSPNPV